MWSNRQTFASISSSEEWLKEGGNRYCARGVQVRGARADRRAGGGRSSILFNTIPFILPHIRAGKLRALAVTSAKRSLLLPEEPTMKEAGCPGVELAEWQGVLAPARTPKEIVAKLDSEFVRTLHLPEIKNRLSSQGAEPVGSTPEEFAAFIKAEMVRWAKVVKASGARAD